MSAPFPAAFSIIHIRFPFLSALHPQPAANKKNFYFFTFPHHQIITTTINYDHFYIYEISLREIASVARRVRVMFLLLRAWRERENERDGASRRLSVGWPWLETVIWCFYVRCGCRFFSWREIFYDLWVAEIRKINTTFDGAGGGQVRVRLNRWLIICFSTFRSFINIGVESTLEIPKPPPTSTTPLPSHIAFIIRRVFVMIWKKNLIKLGNWRNV